MVPPVGIARRRRLRASMQVVRARRHRRTVWEVLVLAPLDLEVVAGAQRLQAVRRVQLVRRRAHRRRADPAPPWPRPSSGAVPVARAACPVFFLERNVPRVLFF